MQKNSKKTQKSKKTTRITKQIKQKWERETSNERNTPNNDLEFSLSEPGLETGASPSFIPFKFLIKKIWKEDQENKGQTNDRKRI